MIYTYYNIISLVSENNNYELIDTEKKNTDEIVELKHSINFLEVIYHLLF